MINGVAAPLFYASATQINAQVPSSTPAFLGFPVPANVVVTTRVGASDAVGVPVYLEGPGIITTDGSGCGQAAALNMAPNGSVSLNSPRQLRHRTRAMFFPPSDGSPVSTSQALNAPGAFAINGNALLPLQYFGLTPNLVGINQANLKIPLNTREGCAVPIVIAGSFAVSQTVSLSIRSSRGQCVDPATQSYGAIRLTKTIFKNTGMLSPPPFPPVRGCFALLSRVKRRHRSRTRLLHC